MKKICSTLGSLIIGSTLLTAQVATFDNEAIARDFVSNLELYSKAYIAPVIGTYSVSQVASNQISGEVLKPFGISLGISASATYLNSQDLIFDFNTSGFSDQLTLSNPNNPVLPTILGGSTTKELVYTVEGQSTLPGGGTFTAAQNISALDGLTSPGDIIPAGAFNFGIGLPQNFEFYVRALPTIDFSGVDNYVFGGGVKHMISSYFQEDESPFHMSAAVFYNTTKFTLSPEKFLDGSKQAIIFTDKVTSFELIASYDKKFFSFFGLIGYYSGDSEFSIDGTYTYEVQREDVPGSITVQEVFSVENPVSIKSSISGIHTSIGGSLKLAQYVSATVAYHVAKNDSLALNLRFYINNGDDD
ncbi:MAG: hypothetical protein JKY48_13675 [Flavobacteriales bacterium]|nr:hypothetical protein [Flavobacteriales bacterium]